jgi:hypothetical protein
MAHLDKMANTASNAPDCPSNWVSFSCDGTYNSKDIAYNNNKNYNNNKQYTQA